MVERGVRLLQLISTDWDGTQSASNHLENSRKLDKPVFSRPWDFEARGLLDSTLVVSTGEFDDPDRAGHPRTRSPSLRPSRVWHGWRRHSSGKVIEHG